METEDSAKKKILVTDEDASQAPENIEVKSEGQNQGLAEVPQELAKEAEETEASIPEPAQTPEMEIVNEPEVVSEVQAEPTKKQPFKRVKIAAFVVASLLILAGGSLAALTLKRGSLVKASVGGVNVEKNKPNEQLTSEINKNLETYKLAITYPDGKTKYFAPNELGVKFDNTKSVEQAQKQLSSAAFYEKLQWWKKIEVPLELNVDETVLDSFITKKATITSKPAKNATLKIDKGIVKISGEKTGVGQTINGGRDKILTSLRQLSNQPITLSDQTLEPKITKAQLSDLEKQIKEKLATPITIEIDKTIFHPDAAEIGNWFEPIDTRSKIASLSFNSGKVLAYLNKIAGPYINTPQNEISVKDKNNKSKIVVKGRNGFDIENKDRAASEIAKELLNAESIDKKLSLKSSSFKKINANSYPRWLIVDVTNKRMYAFEKDKLVKTFLISAGAPGTPTALGEYKIQSKLRSQDMRGANTDGSSYFQADVQYVNYFHQDYAIHGNHWRPLSYFGNINSSHGCVGIVNTDAKWIYEWAPIGTPVITHS